MVQVSAMSVGGAPTPVYLSFSVIEILILTFVVCYAWRWTQASTTPAPKHDREKVEV